MIEALGDDVQAVFADVETVIHMKRDVDLDVDKVEKVLKQRKVKFGAVQRDDGYVL